MRRRNLIVLAIVAAVAVAAIWWRASSRGQGPIVAVTMPALSAALREGQQLFVDNCAACHGDDAGGRKGKGPPLVHLYYRPNHHPDQAFQIAARFGATQHHWNFGNMPPVKGVSEAEVSKIIAFVRAVQKANGID